LTTIAQDGFRLVTASVMALSLPQTPEAATANRVRCWLSELGVRSFLNARNKNALPGFSRQGILNLS
jgi:hypothetical protein